MISAHLADELDFSERQILYGYFNQTGGDNGVPVSGSWAGAPGNPLMATAAVANHIGFGDEDDFGGDEDFGEFDEGSLRDDDGGLDDLLGDLSDGIDSDDLDLD